jgi:hypothetical protein
MFTKNTPGTPKPKYSTKDVVAAKAELTKSENIALIDKSVLLFASDNLFFLKTGNVISFPAGAG